MRIVGVERRRSVLSGNSVMEFGDLLLGMKSDFGEGKKIVDGKGCSNSPEKGFDL